MKEIYVVIYATSSTQKLLDFLKTVYASPYPKLIPVIVKPYGAAAQVGIPEAHRVSYKLNKPLIVLPEISDLIDIIECDCIYYISEEGNEKSIEDLIKEETCRKTALIISSGEQEPSKKELEKVKTIWIHDIPPGTPSTAITGILVYEINKNLK